jgi:peptidyl-prolyl cis-trans isomerase C
MWPPARTPPLSGRFSTAALALPLSLSLALAGCHSKGKAEKHETGDLGKPVARIDDEVITVADLQERINKQSPFVRARFASLDKRKEFLDNIVRFEVMAKEAEKQGYGKDPEVIRTMKQQMISKFLQKEFDAKLKVEDVPDAEVERYYKDHPDEFNRPDQVRVSQILVKDKAKAEKIEKEAKALPKDDGKAFRELVAKVSEDADSKPRGGDLLPFDAKSTAQPKAVVDAAFQIPQVGDISPAVKTDKGYVILRLTQRFPGFSRPLSEVKRQIQQRLFRDLRTKALDKFVEDLKEKAHVTIDEGNLAKVQLETGLEGGAPAPDPRLPVSGLGTGPSAPPPVSPPSTGQNAATGNPMPRGASPSPTHTP